MPKQTSYTDYLKQEFSELIDRIELSDLQKQFMKARWLEQLLWLESQANKSRNRYYRLRMVTIIGGVIVPALISISTNTDSRNWLNLIVIAMSQAVAISAAIEEFFSFGARYRHYRPTAEKMKTEGWHFFQLSGAYSNAQNHADVYTDFAQRVENILQSDVEGYITQIAQEKQKSQKQNNLSSSTTFSPTNSTNSTILTSEIKQ
ncbi:MAG: DUF4231 domain-containing protein [Prochloraceae cyanobacterium]